MITRYDGPYEDQTARERISRLEAAVETLVTELARTSTLGALCVEKIRSQLRGGDAGNKQPLLIHCLGIVDAEGDGEQAPVLSGYDVPPPEEEAAMAASIGFAKRPVSGTPNGSEMATYTERSNESVDYVVGAQGLEPRTSSV